MKAIARVCTVAAVMLLSACATTTFGTNFDSKAALALVPGKTSKEDVAKAVGPLPTMQMYTAKKDAADKELANPMVVEYASYYFSDNLAPAAKTGLRASRHLAVNFIDAKLVNYRLSNNFKDEGTDFDETKVGAVSKGMAEADVIAILGQPSGRSVYPFTREINGTALQYYLLAYDPVTRKIHTKHFTVQLDGNRKVSDFDLKVKAE
jgi:outer membrane protein assembly factor BamE (lipoprotein component of BamABCDE complex)